MLLFILKGESQEKSPRNEEFPIPKTVVKFDEHVNINTNNSNNRKQDGVVVNNDYDYVDGLRR